MGGPASQITGQGSSSSGTVDAQPPPISSGRPANVVAQAVWAWPTSVAITCGCLAITCSRGSGS